MGEDQQDDESWPWYGSTYNISPSPYEAALFDGNQGHGTSLYGQLVCPLQRWYVFLSRAYEFIVN